MAFLNVYDFIQAVLPGLVDPSSGTLDVILSTYRGVGGYQSGPVVLTHRPGLSVSVVGAEGDARTGRIDWLTIGAIVSPAAMRLDPSLYDALNTEKTETFALVQGEIEARVRPLVSDRRGLLIAYAGLSDFEGPINFVREVVARHAGAKGVIVTCDCDIDRKRSKLDPFLVDGSISAAIVTTECGARKEMRAIIDAIIALWPEETVGSGT